RRGSDPEGPRRRRALLDDAAPGAQPARGMAAAAPGAGMTTAGRIRRLPDHVVNKISAGEVVDRPAAAVKELVENALDAESRQIAVELRHAGAQLIRVTDDGIGMAADELDLALLRHATSKIPSGEGP